MEEEMILNHTQERTLYMAHRFRFVTPEIMAKITGKSESTFEHDMPMLGQHGYLFAVQIPHDTTTEPRVVYQLALAGMHVVNKIYGVDMEEMRHKTKPVDPYWIKHTLMNARAIGGGIYAATQDIYASLPIPRISATVLYKGVYIDLTIEPDDAFSLEPEGYHPLIHYHESDTGKEPIVRSNLVTQRSLIQKYLVYLSALKRGEDFVVSTTTSTKKRVENIIGKVWPLLAREGGEEYKDNFIINNIETQLKAPLTSWCNLKGEQAYLVGDPNE